MWQAKVIADSFNIKTGDRLTTLELEYPRFIHSQFMTHRVFSRNAQSNRAIPISKLVHKVEHDPVEPIWTVNKRGMVGDSFLEDTSELSSEWEFARLAAIDRALALDSLGVHKQNVNRLLEPFQWIRVICTATDWDNFFVLRLPHDAQPEIQKLAQLMKAALDDSHPDGLHPTEYHLPYITHSDWLVYAHGNQLEYLTKISVARCARVSYLTHDGKRDHSADLRLYERLKANKHMSPFEHVARPAVAPGRYKNFNGWIQHREEIENENV